MVVLYIFDTNIFYTLGHFYPSRFPTIWRRIDELVRADRLCSVKEVRREIETNCPFEHIAGWVQSNRNIFKAPGPEEMKIVAGILAKEQYRGLVRKTNILRGLPVADPFLIASAKVNQGYVVTQEVYRPDGASIPTICETLAVPCINLERFLEYENLMY